MITPSVKYLDPARVTSKRETATPRGRVNAMGYGSKIPTPWLLQLDGKRWHRVYVVCWSNSGSAYVITKAGKFFLGSYDPRES